LEASWAKLEPSRTPNLTRSMGILLASSRQSERLCDPEWPPPRQLWP
jgi:hypothetical protein